MKRRPTGCRAAAAAMTAMVALCVLVAHAGVARSSEELGLTDLALALETDKTGYLPGELIELRFRMFSRSRAALAPATISVADGSIGVLIARGSDGYLEYRGPDWGVKRMVRLAAVTLNPDQSIEAAGTVLYNELPPTAHLSPMYVKQQLEGLVPTAFAFPDAGSFLLKAVYRDGESDERLESDPVRISITEPHGEDAQVWPILRKNPQLGYVLQTGMLPPTSTAAEKNDALVALADIVRLHPSSAYVARARARLRELERVADGRRPTTSENTPQETLP